jgi:hypothetical protein
LKADLSCKQKRSEEKRKKITQKWGKRRNGRPNLSQALRRADVEKAKSSRHASDLLATADWLSIVALLWELRFGYF